jgi:uncharacterized protein
MEEVNIPSHYAAADEPHLVNSIRGTNTEVFYWRERNREVDFVIRSGRMTVAIEVKSSYPKQALPGMEAFSKEFHVRRELLVGRAGMKADEFLLKPVQELVS